ncbi:uncharacterized protein CIMG_11354 [Coccidioides immitis RS]|uniref:Uncharacterized protein n=6 Tax=Coccidioides TaxID=5500 RepID=A0A0D8JUM7_COCIM|nr:uncharacterized protein CIMG_11354 [Coccidioides immitis RS]EFW17183.1 conserved hypothetical protein [Coccidioides posadasii str. Silveira]KMM70094.1 hypothetical protein CPAG_06406 [Coccidioides posadasii RMSCC 3488]KMP04759.1 hypothetical protein CIRG_04440 [Coccidioides immitis RMSCC 2394]KMU77523.1 hypothetical protein CISG_06525 [Coccidioides immitis RMSCC 3703]KMU89084.1 hypothetical protein CIHG_06886 [Coccidioides immitis H538.4]TPX21255.1 hypothetical protein DIZ76_015211 [Coccid
MAQGAIKKAKPAASSTAKRPAALGPKKGARAIAPKKAALVKQKKLSKKLSAGLTAKMEQNLAEKAGHLELLRGGKKSAKSDKRAEKGAGNKK